MASAMAWPGAAHRAASAGKVQGMPSASTEAALRQVVKEQVPPGAGRSSHRRPMEMRRPEEQDQKRKRPGSMRNPGLCVQSWEECAYAPSSPGCKGSFARCPQPWQVGLNGLGALSCSPQSTEARTRAARTNARRPGSGRCALMAMREIMIGGSVEERRGV